MLNFALFSVSKGYKNAPFISPASDRPILIESDRLSSGEYRTESTENCL